MNYNRIEMKKSDYKPKKHPVIISAVTYVLTLVFETLNIIYGTKTFHILTQAFFTLSMINQIVLLVFERIVSRRGHEAMKEADVRLSFLSNLSHEIRTPLNGIIGLNHISIQNFSDQETVHNNLLKTDRTARYLSTMINDVMEYSRFKSGTMKFDIKDVLIGTLLDNICSMEWSSFLEKGIILNLKTDLNVQCIKTDEMRIRQVLMALLTNACKYTPKGGTVTVSAIQMQTGNKDVTTMIAVTDTGIGISEERQKELFNAFTGTPRDSTNGQGGIGLSLTVGKKVMNGLGGDLYVKSEEGQGSTFTMYLPSEISEATPEELIEKELKTVDLVHKKDLNILAAEDNELNSEILCEILKGSGYKVTMAKDGFEALQYFMDSKPGEYDLILMDIRMPNMNGYEAARNIRDQDRSDAKKIPIYACSANTFAEDRDMAAKSGMNDFIAKPIDINKLLTKLGELENSEE